MNAGNTSGTNVAHCQRMRVMARLEYDGRLAARSRRARPFLRVVFPGVPMLSHYPGIAPLPRKVSRTSWAARPGPAVARWPLCAECGRPMSHLLQAPAGGGRGSPALPFAGRRSAVRIQARVGQHLQLLGRGRRRQRGSPCRARNWRTVRPRRPRMPRGRRARNPAGTRRGRLAHRGRWRARRAGIRVLRLRLARRPRTRSRIRMTGPLGMAHEVRRRAVLDRQRRAGRARRKAAADRQLCNWKTAARKWRTSARTARRTSSSTLRGSAGLHDDHQSPTGRRRRA